MVALITARCTRRHVGIGDQRLAWEASATNPNLEIPYLRRTAGLNGDGPYLRIDPA